MLVEVKVQSLGLDRSTNTPVVILQECGGARVLPIWIGPGEASADVLLEQPEHGGHVGFLTGPLPGRLDWLPARLLHFFHTSRPHRTPVDSR